MPGLKQIIRCLKLIMILSALLLVPFSGCGKPSVDQNAEPARYTSFRDVPGITAEEIRAIEAFQEQKRVFVYGMPLSKEAFLDEYGKIGGFSARLCDWLSELFGVQFRLEHYELAELFAGLESGAVDFTGELRATEERRHIYQMTDPVAERTLKYFRLSNSPSLQQIASMRKPRYGFMEGATTANTVISRLESGSVEAVFIGSMDHVYDMLKNETIDAFFYTSPAESRFDEYADVAAYDFFPLVFSPVSIAAQNPRLKPIISVIQKVLENGGYDYLSWLYGQGARDHRKQKLMIRLSGEEMAYVSGAGAIPFAAEHYNYPISFYNKYEKQWHGIFFDILKEMEALTGMSFYLVNDEFTEWPDLIELLESGQASMISELLHSKEREGRFLWSKIPVLTDRYALLSKSETRNISVNEVLNTRVALPLGTAYAEMFRSWFPDHTKLIEYESSDEAFLAMDRGDVDMVISSERRLLALLNYHELSGYKLNFVFDYPAESVMGFNKNETVLCSIIDKTLQLIDFESITGQWMSKTYDYKGKLARAQRPWLIGAAILFLCTLILILILLQIKRHEGNKLEELVTKRTNALEKQLALMSVVNDAAVLLLESNAENYIDALNNSMNIFCGHMEADHVSLWQNNLKDDSKLYYRQVCKWTHKDAVTPKNLLEFPFKDTLPEWEKVLSTGQSLNGPVDQIPNREHSFLSDQKIQSILVVPLFLNNNFSGFVSLDDCQRQHVFPEAEKQALQTWGLLAMGAIQRGEIAREMQQALVDSVDLQKDLKVAMEAAKAANTAKSYFLANMSHEIRTPMNSIVGFSELAMDDDITAKTKDYLGKIQANAESLLQIINDILDISKIESGKMDLERIPFSMHELFNSCRTLIMPKAVEKGITLHFYAEPSIAKMPLGDPTRLRQVLVNLLSNAIKFTNNGTVKLYMVIKETTDKIITMHFEVKDPGIGMTKEQIDKVFDPFTQAESGTTRKYGGTGLGLTITKSIVELMGGELLVESTPGTGSAFSFELSFETIDAPENAVSGKKEEFAEIKKPAFEGEILLCEDNVMNQQVIIEHLARVGIKTVSAANGKIGVEMVQNRMEKGEKQFNLIFMDMHMPVMDGLEASEKIIKLNTGIPIVAMTANIMANDREIYRMNGINDCVGKPFTSQELWRCLLKYFTPVNQEKESQPEDDFFLKADKEFRKKLHLLFIKENREKFEEMAKALESDDIKLAHRLAHTLKGNAGQIGKNVLQSAAAIVEQQLKDGKNLTTDEQMETLKTELNAALNEFAPLLAEPAAQSGAEMTLEPPKVKELLEKLEPLLKSGNPECLDYVNDLGTITDSDGLINQLIQQMEDFEFGTALSTFAKLREKWM